jgi:hypothetical protein
LCPNCHINEAHGRPLEFTDFIREYLGGERYEALREKSYTNLSPKRLEWYFETFERLKEIAQGLHIDIK